MGPECANELHVFLRQNRCVADILEKFDEIALPDAWLVAGCIAQTIWNLACGQPAELGIKDVDLIYFDDQDLSPGAEAGHERRLRNLFGHLAIKLDVKNEARVHLWYQQRFGYAIERYTSSADAIATFPDYCNSTRGTPDTWRVRMLRTVRPRRSVRPRCQTKQKADNTVDLRGESRALAFYLASAKHPALGRDGFTRDRQVILA